MSLNCLLERMGSINKSTKGPRILCSVTWAQKLFKQPGGSCSVSSALPSHCRLLPVASWLVSHALPPCSRQTLPPSLPKSCLSSEKSVVSCKCHCPAQALSLAPHLPQNVVPGSGGSLWLGPFPSPVQTLPLLCSAADLRNCSLFLCELALTPASELPDIHLSVENQF